MEFTSALVVADLVGLSKEGKIRTFTDTNALDLQVVQLMKLSSRAKSTDPIHRFLSVYDIIMRLAEIQVLLNGYLFDNSPHVAMRKVVSMICPECTEVLLKELSNTRHLAKKNNVVPQARSIQDLEDVLAKLASRTVVNGSIDWD